MSLISTISRHGRERSRFVPIEHLTILGSVGGSEYAMLGEQEVMLSSASAEPTDFAGAADAQFAQVPATDRMGVDHRRLWPVAPGTYQREVAKRAKGARLAERRDTPRPVCIRLPERVEGCRSMADARAAYERRGFVFALTPGRGYLDVRAPAGRILNDAERAWIARTAPLHVADLRGEPVQCSVAAHKNPAISILETGAPICQECLGGAS